MPKAELFIGTTKVKVQHYSLGGVTVKTKDDSPIQKDPEALRYVKPDNPNKIELLAIEIEEYGLKKRNAFVVIRGKPAEGFQAYDADQCPILVTEQRNWTPEEFRQLLERMEQSDVIPLFKYRAYGHPKK